MAYIVKPYIVKAYIVMAYIVMACIVMALPTVLAGLDTLLPLRRLDLPPLACVFFSWSLVWPMAHGRWPES